MDEESFKETPHSYQSIDQGEAWVLFTGGGNENSVKVDCVSHIVDFLKSHPATSQ